jgi:carboxymethylenebutenolidase
LTAALIRTLVGRRSQVAGRRNAIDYFGCTAGLSSRDESFEFMPHVQQTKSAAIFADAAAALAE